MISLGIKGAYFKPVFFEFPEDDLFIFLIVILINFLKVIVLLIMNQKEKLDILKN